MAWRSLIAQKRILEPWHISDENVLENPHVSFHLYDFISLELSLSIFSRTGHMGHISAIFVNIQNEGYCN